MEIESQAQPAAASGPANGLHLAANRGSRPLSGVRTRINRISARTQEASQDLERDFFTVPVGDGLLHVNLWPRVVAIEQIGTDDSWRSREPHLDVAAESIAMRCDEPPPRLVEWICARRLAATGDLWVWAAVSQIPNHVREAISPFRFGQWPLLRLASAYPRFLELLASNPALGWMFANSGPRVCENQPDPLATAKMLLPLRQRVIAEWLGLPGTETTVRVMRKIPPTDCSKMAHRALLHLSDRPGGLDVFRHFHRVPVVVLMAAATEPLGPRLTDRFFRQFDKALAAEERDDAEEGDGSPAQILEDTIRLQATLGDVALPERVHSLPALVRLHDQLVGERRFRAECKRDFSLPPPPIPPCDGIEPLDTARKIYVEASGQHHCLDTYLFPIQARGYYAYRVTRNGRATVGIRRKRDGSWRIEQIRGAHNSKVPAGLRRFVRQWFLSHVPAPSRQRIGRRRAESELQLLMPFATG